MSAKLFQLEKTKCLVLSLSGLVVLVAQGCSVDIDHLRVSTDAAAARLDARIDTAAADSMPVYGDSALPDLVLGLDASPDEGNAVDLRSSANDGGGASRVDVQPAPDGAATNDAAMGLDLGAPEVTVSIDTADAVVVAPDTAATVDTAPVPDVALDLPPDLGPDGPSTVVNISQGKPATASSQQPGKEAIFGNDGATNTSFCGADVTFPTWWRVDLGATFNIVRTEVAFEKPEYAYLYKVEVSGDDATYTTVADRSTNASRAEALTIDTFTAQARYVRITVLGVSPSPSARGCFFDFAVWGYASADSPAASLTNFALSGTAYRWYGNTEATANSNRIAEPKLNDNSISADVSLAGSVYPDGKNNYEAAGVLLPHASTISSVVFVHGATVAPPPFIPGDPDGNFTGDFHLQLSTDGSTWTDATGWSLSPAYPYDASASNRAYVFSGSATAAVGVRVTGVIHPDDVQSAYARGRELQVWGR